MEQVYFQPLLGNLEPARKHPDFIQLGTKRILVFATLWPTKVWTLCSDLDLRGLAGDPDGA